MIVKLVPPDGYCLRNEPNEFMDSTCWLYRHRKDDPKPDVRVARIDMRGKTYCVMFVSNFKSLYHENLQTLLLNACTYDRLTSTMKG